MKRDIEHKITEILDHYISYGYEFQMSDYAYNSESERGYERKGRQEVERAVKAIQKLVASERKEARTGKLEKEKAIIDFCQDLVAAATNEYQQVDWDYIARQVQVRANQPEIEKQLRKFQDKTNS